MKLTSEQIKAATSAELDLMAAEAMGWRWFDIPGYAVVNAPPHEVPSFERAAEKGVRMVAPPCADDLEEAEIPRPTRDPRATWVLIEWAAYHDIEILFQRTMRVIASPAHDQDFSVAIEWDESAPHDRQIATVRAILLAWASREDEV